MWSRPDTGAAPTSYPAPTWSAAKGLFESIAFLSSGQAWFHPTRVEVCRPAGAKGGLSYQRYATNYGGPLRKDHNISSGTAMQIFATVLANACYRLYAEVRGPTDDMGGPKHHLSDLFARRLRQGRVHRTPCLGLSEFTCSYWGTFREGVETDESVNIVVPSMLSRMWSRPHDGVRADTFTIDARIESGVLEYPD